MNPQFFQKLFSSLGDWAAKNGRTIAIAGGSAAAGSIITVAICNKAHKNIETKHRKEDAEKYKAVFDRRVKEIENKYKNNEAEMKRKVNELCRELGIDPLY